MIKTKNILLLFILLFLLNPTYAATITQRGSIAEMSMEKRAIKINIEVNKVKLITHSYPLNLSRVKVWWNHKRLYIGRLKKGMKIEFRSKKGKIYSIRVLNSNGHDLEPQG
ncbi:MAG: hypothetical protein QM500_14610 [Methylococcales bacterium]